MTSIATQILEAQRRKKIAAAFVKQAVGAGAYSSTPVWGSKGVSPAAASGPKLSPSERAQALKVENPLPSLNSVGNAIWNNGGQQAANLARQTGRGIWNNGGQYVTQQAMHYGPQVGNAIWNHGGQQAWNYAGKPVLNAGMNTMGGISTMGTGAANLAAGTLGTAAGGIGTAVGDATDAAGLTNGMGNWVDQNVTRHMTNAMDAGARDMFGGAADTLSGGYYDYDGSKEMRPGAHSGTAVERMRSGIRDELGRGSDLDTAFRGTNVVSDIASDMAAFGAAGRGANVAAKTLQASPLAAPALGVAAKTPVVGKPLAAVGNWFAGPAPAANMFAQTPTQYYRAAMGGAATPAALGRQFGDDAINAGTHVAMSNVDRPQERLDAEQAAHVAGATRQLQRQDNQDYAMARAMMHDPAIQHRMSYGGPDAPLPQSDLRKAITAIHETQGPAAAEQFAAEQSAKTVAQADVVGNILDAEGNNGQPGYLYPPEQTAATGQFNVPDEQQPMELPNTQPAQQPAASPAQEPAAQESAQPAQQTAGQPAQTQNSTAAPGQSFDTKPYEAQFKAAKTPEEQAQVRTQFTNDWLQTNAANIPDELKTSAAAWAKDPSSKDAAAFAQQLGGAGSAFQQQHISAAIASNPDVVKNPDLFGRVTAQASQMWDALGPMGQMAVTFGVPAAMIGMLGGGGLSMLLGGLGIGALGVAGAGMGLFGAGGQAAAGKMMGDVGNFLGMIPDEARDANNLSPNSPASKAFEAQVAQTFKTQGPAAAQKLVDARTAQFAPLEQMHSANPALAHSYLMGMQNGPKTPEEAAALYKQVSDQAMAARDPNFLRNKATQTAAKQVESAQNLVPAWARVGAFLGKEYIPGVKGLLPEQMQQMIDAGVEDPNAVARRRVDELYKRGASVRHLVQKTARCWAGYEPVPGKAPYSEDSCRPKTKKKPRKATNAHKQQSGS